MSMPVISRHNFSIEDLAKKWPPIFEHPHKRLIYELVEMMPPEVDGSLPIEFSRWPTQQVSDYPFQKFATEVSVETDFFDYSESQNSENIAWYMNFAHCELFCAYGGPLLAQDELQCLEHPALGSVLEALRALSTKDSGLPQSREPAARLFES